MATAEMKAKLATAEKGLKATQDAVTTIGEEIVAAQTERDGLDGLHELSTAQHLQLENARRLLRKLAGQQEVAQAAVAAAEAVRAAAERDVTISKREAAFDALEELDRDFIVDVKATAARLGEKLAAFTDKKTEVHAFDYDLDPAPGAHQRHSFNLLTTHAAWNEPVLLGAQRVLAAVAARETPYVFKDPMEAAKSRPYAPYKPPYDEHGSWDDPTRPDPGHGANGP